MKIFRFIMMIAIVFSMSWVFNIQEGVTQDMRAIRLAANEVNNNGILFSEPANYWTIFDDFTSIDSIKTNGQYTPWSFMVISEGAGTSTITIEDLRGGILKFTNAANDNDGVVMQYNAELVNLDTTGRGSGTYKKNAWLNEWFIKLDSVMTTDLFVGLTTTVTDADSGSVCDSLNSVADGVYFYKKDDNDTLFTVTVLNTDSIEITQTNAVLVAGVASKLKIIWDGRFAVEFFVNGKRVATHNTIAYLPTDELLAPTLCYLNGEAVAMQLWADYFWHDNERAAIW